MKSTKVFNNISDKLRKQIPKLKPGEVVTFQMTNGTPNPDPDEKERSKYPMLYGKIQMRTNFRIFDPHIKDESGGEGGGYVDVGCVDTWKGDMPERFRMFVPGMGEYSRFGGKFSLTGGNQKDDELYEILWLSPEREGSPCQDSSITAIFKILDLKADSKTAVTKFDILKKSLDIATKLKDDEPTARAIMAALNQPTYQDKEVLMAKLGEIARNTPDTFIATYESPDTPTRSIIREAIDARIIDHDLPTGQVKMGGVVITTIKMQAGETFVPQFAKWIIIAENGKEVLNNIKKSLEKKEEEVAK